MSGIKIYRNISLKYDIKYASKVDLMERYNALETLRMYSPKASVLLCNIDRGTSYAQYKFAVKLQTL